ncbi:BTB/POZ domain-containing protein 2-like isoform X2 [Argiope bruennichi]|nr:BTB/POZ domain-containing protein 2-like isoform X2 [Argiope bruennichi]
MHTDVSFSVKCGDGWMDYSAHKLILSMWSPVFADMCYKPRNESDGPIRIEDISPSTFDAMLKFMYGCLPDRHLKDIPFLLKLYKGAVAYEVEALKNLCSEIFLCATPTKYNVFQLLDAGKLLDCESLVQRCYKILQTKTAEVLAAQELCNITPAMLTTILNMPYVSFTSEYELISWVFAWVKNELLKDSQKRSFKEILGDFLPYLNFLNLTSEEFAKLFQNRKSDLMSEQEGFSIFMNIALPGSYPLPSWYPSSPKHREYKNHAYMASGGLKSMDSFERSFQSLG